jgi:hypothetical protein
MFLKYRMWVIPFETLWKNAAHVNDKRVHTKVESETHANHGKKGKRIVAEDFEKILRFD